MGSACLLPYMCENIGRMKFAPRDPVPGIPRIKFQKKEGKCVGKGTLTHTITLSNASIDDFRYVKEKRQDLSERLK